MSAFSLHESRTQLPVIFPHCNLRRYAADFGPHMFRPPMHSKGPTPYELACSGGGGSGRGLGGGREADTTKVNVDTANNEKTMQVRMSSPLFLFYVDSFICFPSIFSSFRRRFRSQFRPFTFSAFARRCFYTFCSAKSTSAKPLLHFDTPGPCSAIVRPRSSVMWRTTCCAN